MYKPGICTATDLYLRTRGSASWNLTSEERNALIRKRCNAYGTSYAFADGSAIFVPRGTADVHVRKREGGRPILA